LATGELSIQEESKHFKRLRR